LRCDEAPRARRAWHAAAVAGRAAAAGLRHFVSDLVLGIPDLPELIIVKSVLKGVPVAYMQPGDGVAADVLAAAQEQLAFAANRLV
jgi:hypothetical protein